MLSTTTTALSTSMPTANSRPIMVRMFSVTPTKYMKPRVMVKQIGMARVTISVDGSTVDYFQSMEASTGIPYQTLISLYLRDCAETCRQIPTPRQ